MQFMNASAEGVLNEPQFGPLDVIIWISLMGFAEGWMLLMVFQSSWKSYAQTHRAQRSVCKFLRNISFMRKCFIVAGFLIFSFNFLFLLQMLLPLRYDDYLCSLSLRLTARTSYSIPMASVYLFLWTRQYLLHSSPLLGTVVPKWFYILSKISLLLTIVAFLLPLFFTWKGGNWPVVAVYREGTCYMKDSNGRSGFTTIISGLSIITQMSYMCLFYKTLKMHQQVNKNVANAQSKNSLQHHARRCFVFTIMTVMTDCLSMAFINFIPSSALSLFRSQLVAKTDLMINMVCMMFCFKTLPGFVISLIRLITCGRYQLSDDGEKGASSNQSAINNQPAARSIATVAKSVEQNTAA